MLQTLEIFPQSVSSGLREPRVFNLAPLPFSVALCDMRNLRSFSCGSMPIDWRHSRQNIPTDWNAVSYLASLPNLTDLACAMIHQDAIITQDRHARPKPFPSLRYLKFQGPPRAFKAFIQQFLRENKLATMVFKNTDPLDNAELGAIFSALVPCISVDSLTSIVVIQAAGWDVHGNYLKFADFLPIFKFPNLQNLTIDTDLHLEELSDDLLEAISLAWPRLRDLHLGPRLHSESFSGFTLEGLLHLADRCTDLQSLYLFFEAWAESSSTERPGRGITCPSMTSFGVGDSPVDDTLEIAAFLSDVFPNAHIWSRWDDLEEETDSEDDIWNKKSWEEVRRFFKVFADVRRQERSWHTKNQ